MNKKYYTKTKYPGIWKNIKNDNYVIDLCYKGYRSSISTIDGTRSGQKIYDIKIARRIQNDPTILKRFVLSINNKTTIQEAFEAYIYNAKNNLNLAPRTLKRKRQIYNQYLAPYASKKIFNVTKEDMLQVKIKIDKNNTKSSSKYTCFKEIKSFWNWLKQEKVIDETPTSEIMQFKKEKILHAIWSASEVDIFRKECEKDFENTNILIAYKARMIHLLVNLNYSSAIRIGESRALQFKKINYETNELIINANIGIYTEISDRTKTDESKDIILLPPAISNEISNYEKWIKNNLNLNITSDTPLFFNPNTLTPYSSTVINQIFNLYRERAGLKKMPIYNLRHSSAALMQAMNYEIYTIQNRLRHKNVETTINTYGTITQETKRKLVDDLSRFF